MARTLSLLFCSLLISFALAAPVPKARDEAFRQAPWGRPIDPDKDCQFAFTKGSVTIALPGKPHDYDPDSGRTNAPRLLRAVEGDFLAEVRVRGEWQAAGKEDRHSVSPSVTAGLLLVGQKEGQGCFRAAFGTYLWNQRQLALAVVGVSRPGPSPTSYWYGTGPELRPWARGATGAAYLRMERRGDEVSCSISADGKRWQPLSPHKLDPREEGEPFRFRGAARVGVAAFTTSTKPAKVTFDNFKLTPLKAKKD